MYSAHKSVALLIQHATRMPHILLSSVASLVVQGFSTLSHKRHDFRKKKLLNIKCVFWISLQHLTETFLVLRRNERVTVINVGRCLCKVPVTLVKFSCTLNFSADFRKKYSNITFHENLSSESRDVSCGRRDGQMTKLMIFFFFNSANACQKASVRISGDAWGLMIGAWITQPV